MITIATRVISGWWLIAQSAVVPTTVANNENHILLSVFRVNFMVKLLRACVWMPWRKKAMKDVASCDKLRVGASNL